MVVIEADVNGCVSVCSLVRGSFCYTQINVRRVGDYYIEAISNTLIITGSTKIIKTPNSSRTTQFIHIFITIGERLRKHRKARDATLDNEGPLKTKKQNHPDRYVTVWK